MLRRPASHLARSSCLSSRRTSTVHARRLPGLSASRRSSTQRHALRGGLAPGFITLAARGNRRVREAKPLSLTEIYPFLTDSKGAFPHALRFCGNARSSFPLPKREKYPGGADAMPLMEDRLKIELSKTRGALPDWRFHRTPPGVRGARGHLFGRRCRVPAPHTRREDIQGAEADVGRILPKRRGLSENPGASGVLFPGRMDINRPHSKCDCGTRFVQVPGFSSAEMPPSQGSRQSDSLAATWLPRAPDWLPLRCRTPCRACRSADDSCRPHRRPGNSRPIFPTLGRSRAWSCRRIKSGRRGCPPPA